MMQAKNMAPSYCPKMEGGRNASVERRREEKNLGRKQREEDK